MAVHGREKKVLRLIEPLSIDLLCFPMRNKDAFSLSRPSHRHTCPNWRMSILGIGMEMEMEMEDGREMRRRPYMRLGLAKDDGSTWYVGEGCSMGTRYTYPSCCLSPLRGIIVGDMLFWLVIGERGSATSAVRDATCPLATMASTIDSLGMRYMDSHVFCVLCVCRGARTDAVAVASE